MTKKRRGRRSTPARLLLPLLTTLGVSCFAVVGLAAETRPNILLVFLDNTGWADFGPYGGGALRGAPSPTIDRLAKEGVTLLNFNTEAQCTPSRSALMTGRFAIRSGTHSVPIGVPYYGLVPWERTLAEILSDAGYMTGHFGKWHLGKTSGRYPTDQGFDEWYGIPNSTDEMFWSSPDLLRPFTDAALAEQVVPEAERPFLMEGKKGKGSRRIEPYTADTRRTIDADLVARTKNFMKRAKRKGKRFFAYVPLTAMHYPTLPHPDFEGRSPAGMYGDMLVQTDHYVGELLEALDDLGISDDTLVIFTADNGVEDPVNGDGHFTGWTGPWSGTYFTAMEGGLRVPFIARWPGRIEAGRTTNGIAHLVDLMPTLAGWAGAEMPADRPVDGVDLGEFIEGGIEASPRKGFPVYVADTLHAVKWRDWKAHYVWQPTKNSPKQSFSTLPRIVNLLQDPGETRQSAEPFNTWIQYGAIQMMLEFEMSMRKSPSVPVGAPDDWQPEGR